MNDSYPEEELRPRLEKALRRPLRLAEWDFLVYVNVVRDYQFSPLEGEEKWEEFKESSKAALKKFDELHLTLLQEDGKPPSQYHRPLSEDRRMLVEAGVRSSERTLARTEALRSLNQLRVKADRIPDRPAIVGAIFPRGGADGTVPQWVYVLQAELWVPAEEIKEDYKVVQQALSGEASRKTDPRTLEVARFVWEERQRAGDQALTYKDLMKLWNKRHPKDEGFNNWRTFRTYFFRGRDATLPRYKSDESLRKEAEGGYGLDLFEDWAGVVRRSF